MALPFILGRAPMDIKELETNSQCQVALNQSVELAMLSDQACEPAGQTMCKVFRLTTVPGFAI